MRLRDLNSFALAAYRGIPTFISIATTVHKGEMETLLTHKFQMFEDVPLLAA